MKVLIVGGVAGGMSAATRLRRLQEDAEIVVFEQGPYVSFANCGLPYHLSGEIADREELVLQTPEKLAARFRLDVRVNTEVTKILPEEKKIVAEDGQGSYEESYDRLILSPGAVPVVPPLQGLDEAENVFTLRNIPDLDQIMAHIEEGKGAKATVIGAGFIGLEMAENLAKRGYEVTIVEMAQQVLPPLDVEMAHLIEEELVRQGLQVLTGKSAQAFEDQGRRIVLNDGTVLESDLTILSVGVRPNTKLAEEAGIETGARGGILVDDEYQTNIEGIYAVGDAILVNQQLTGEESLIALANLANREGRQVADIISGRERKRGPALGTSIVRVFDLTAASTGLNERLAREKFEDVAVVHTQSMDHAGYYPGASPMELKLVFNPKTQEIYGAQGVGKKGVDKRIDVLATAIRAGLKVSDLPELELSYAPPFGSAKDPVNMLGYTALNIAEGFSKNVQWHELEDELKAGKKLLDVREYDELEADGYLPSAQHIPLNELRDRLDELDPRESYVVFCASGQRSYLAERLLRQKDFKVSNLDGAFKIIAYVYPDLVAEDYSK